MNIIKMLQKWLLNKKLSKLEEKESIFNNMTLETYKQLLEDHNWNYISSKDSQIVEKGRASHNNLLRLSMTNGRFKEEFFKVKETKLPPQR